MRKTIESILAHGLADIVLQGGAWGECPLNTEVGSGEGPENFGILFLKMLSFDAFICTFEQN